MFIDWLSPPMRTIFIAALLPMALICSAGAADLDAGKTKAGQCAVCHGQNGMAVLAEAPNLAGQSEIYLREQLRNYRSGRRNNEVMAVMAKPLSDTDIENLAAWYAAIELTLKMPK